MAPFGAPRKAAGHPVACGSPLKDRRGGGRGSSWTRSGRGQAAGLGRLALRVRPVGDRERPHSMGSKSYFPARGA